VLQPLADGGLLFLDPIRPFAPHYDGGVDRRGPFGSRLSGRRAQGGDVVAAVGSEGFPSLKSETLRPNPPVRWAEELYISSLPYIENIYLAPPRGEGLLERRLILALPPM